MGATGKTVGGGGGEELSGTVTLRVESSCINNSNCSRVAAGSGRVWVVVNLFCFLLKAAAAAGDGVVGREARRGSDQYSSFSAGCGGGGTGVGFQVMAL